MSRATPVWPPYPVGRAGGARDIRYRPVHQPEWRKLGTLRAFSGEVRDPELSPDGFSDRSQTPDPNLQGDICEACKHSGDQILQVANTVQTGVDQPLPCGREVNRRHDGIQTLQPLPRLIHALQQPVTETAEIGGDSLICMVAIR